MNQPLFDLALSRVTRVHYISGKAAIPYPDKNPHTGEVVETKGGNHKTRKEWKAEHGSVNVESWLTK